MVCYIVRAGWSCGCTDSLVRMQDCFCGSLYLSSTDMDLNLFFILVAKVCKLHA